ncbi:unnamed protein product [Adineta ricciae]|uniref:Uncharacterized protein n=1 Tax=Adineta ricciae TaxID=249248 RepID=A0A815WAF6_ADIRI|nr:unnamed protein product [Adineta ricciae]
MGEERISPSTFVRNQLFPYYADVDFAFLKCYDSSNKQSYFCCLLAEEVNCPAHFPAEVTEDNMIIGVKLARRS